jgi:hypothetical protein
MPVLAPPVVPLPVPPEALEPLLTPPHCFTQLSRSRPVRPMHWLGSVELPAALVSELVLAPPEVVAPVLGAVLGAVLGEVLGEALGAVLGDVLDPVLLPYEPPDCCAHATLATATNAAATAAVIALTITVESPWSVEEDCTARACKSGAHSAIRLCSADSTDKARLRGHCPHDRNSSHTVFPGCHP